MLQLLPAILGAALALLASAALGQQSVPRASPIIRPILTSFDPQGDDTKVCYVKGDSPEAMPDACVVEVTDTLDIAAGGDYTQEFVLDVLLGPQNEVVASASPHHTVESAVPHSPYFPPGTTSLYIPPGTKLGVYRFRGHVGPRPVAGGFTIRPSSKRVLQLSYANEQQQTGAYVELAGYPPGATVPVDVYTQISFCATNCGAPRRKWRYAQKLGDVTVDGRGEQLVRLAFDVHRVRGNFLLVTEPQQENDFTSGTHVADGTE